MHHLRSILTAYQPKPCPQPATIEHHLKENTTFEGSIKEGDQVCYACYRSHLFTLQQNKYVSTDYDLKQLIATIHVPTNIQSTTDLIEAAMNRVAIAVGTELLDRNVLLLPSVHDLFCSIANELSVHLDEVITPSKLVTSAYILSSLTATLQHHITCYCKIKKYGTVLYRPDTDLNQALAKTLWQLRTKDHPSAETTNHHTQVLQDLNSRACSHIQSFLNQYSKQEFNMADLNIPQLIADIDPKLWEAVCLLTMSVSEKKGRWNTASSYYHTKQVRRFVLFSIMMFCINDQYTIPLHTLITDVIESQGGSTELVKILNQLGLCASSDTLARYIQHKSINLDDTMKHCLTPDSFTVVSADNIDFIHSYARVYKGSSASSWHGTSIQVVQPLPSLSMETAADHVHCELPYHLSNSNSAQCPPEEIIESELTLKRKRTDSSPRPAPMMAPAMKKLRQPRTGMEHIQSTNVHQHATSSHQFTSVTTSVGTGENKTISDFLPNALEMVALQELKEELEVYMLQKVAVSSKHPNKNFVNMQDYFLCTRATHTEKSNVFYHNIMDAKSDSKDTLVSMLHDLHQNFVQKRGLPYLLVEGDAKLYELLQSLKFEYRDELLWLIPYPGDWHMLMNFQSALLKPYFDAGLKSLAEACGYPIAAIQHCSQFKKTHYFILEAWEALYRSMLTTFIMSPNIKGTSQSLINTVLELLSLTEAADNEGEFRKKFNSAIGAITTAASPFLKQFDSFIRKMSAEDETWRFWVQFVFVDAMAYISLYLAMRSGNWHLRMCSMKNMAPVFTAFDHPTYQKLISNHLSDLVNLPASIQLMLAQGAFVVNISGREWHSVGIDEAHEMLINKQCKSSVVKPTADYINRVAHYIPHRTRALQNLRQQCSPQPVQKHGQVKSLYSSRSLDKKCEMNVKAQMHALQNTSIFSLSSAKRGLINPFTGITASDQAYHELQNNWAK